MTLVYWFIVHYNNTHVHYVRKNTKQQHPLQKGMSMDLVMSYNVVSIDFRECDNIRYRCTIHYILCCLLISQTNFKPYSYQHTNIYIGMSSPLSHTFQIYKYWYTIKRDNYYCEIIHDRLIKESIKYPKPHHLS